MRILVVEDDTMYRRMTCEMMRGWGFDAAAADTGAKAVEMAGRQDFDLFLLDVFLPDMTARELVPAFRTLQPEVPIITLTGQSSRRLERELRELGIAYYMAKPVPHDELRSILEHLSRRSVGGRPAGTVRDASMVPLGRVIVELDPARKELLS